MQYCFRTVQKLPNKSCTYFALESETLFFTCKVFQVRKKTNGIYDVTCSDGIISYCISSVLEVKDFLNT